MDSHDISEIACAYESACACDSGMSNRIGEHAVLIAVLRGKGISVNSVMQAYDVCEQILYGDFVWIRH